LNILTVVINNYCWGMSRSGQELLYEGVTEARPISTLSPSTAFEIVAQGLGCSGSRVDKVEEIEATVKTLSKEKRPSCLNLIVSDKPIHPVTKSMVNVTEDKNYIVVPYYDNIPRPYYKV
jgi:thiamine pyrophosphate-dependent acetolactate synthase large subunit-like protein